jgi:hypothetical protein
MNIINYRNIIGYFQPMKLSNLILTIWGLLSFVFFACQHTPVIPVSPAISYSTQIEPIILNNCATIQCHDGKSRRLALNNYTMIMQVVQPFSSKNSRLYTAITALAGDRAMPRNSPLSHQQIDLIYTWIMQGAPNN